MEKLKEVLLKFFKLESIVANITGYVESRVALVKMELREEVAGVISRGLIIVIMMLIGFLFILFLSIGMAGYLNTMFEGDFAGFFLVGGFYGLLLLLMIIFRKNLLRTLEKKFATLIRQKQD
jgi:membrane protease YdiL (CAAX protease family)